MLQAIPKKPGNPAWQRGGPSPNPGGRPAIIGELRDLAREHTAEALATLVEVMKDGAAPHAARTAAATAILDRAFGRPAQEVALQADVSVEVEERPVDPIDMARRVAFSMALAAANPPVIEGKAGAEGRED